jgi:hypothetical protein
VTALSPALARVAQALTNFEFKFGDGPPIDGLPERCNTELEDKQTNKNGHNARNKRKVKP